ncbi:MAG TPA: hypothetical protein VGQ83_10500 [Polyangia bacterium]
MSAIALTLGLVTAWYRVPVGGGVRISGDCFFERPGQAMPYAGHLVRYSFERVLGNRLMVVSRDWGRIERVFFLDDRRIHRYFGRSLDDMTRAGVRPHAELAVVPLLCGDYRIRRVVAVRWAKGFPLISK